MKTNRKISPWTILLAVIAVALTIAGGLNLSSSVSASGGNDLGTSPFDFSDATYRAHGILPENIVLRVGTAGRAGAGAVRGVQRELDCGCVCAPGVAAVGGLRR